MTVRRKIIILLILAVFPLAMAGGVIFKLSLESAENYKAINQRQLQSLLLAKSARTLFYSYNKEVEIGLSTSEIDLLANHLVTITQVVEDLRNIAKLGVYKEKAESLAFEIEDFPKKVAHFFDLLSNNGINSPVVIVAAKEIHLSRTRISDELLELEERCLADYKSEFDRANSQQSTFGQVIWISTTIIVLILAIFSLKLITPVLRRIKILQKHFVNTALDKLEPLNVNDEKDELDQLVKASNAMLMGMKEARRQLIDMQIIDKILANLGDVLIIVDSKGIIKRVNSRASQFADLPSEQLVGQKLVDIFLTHVSTAERGYFETSLIGHINDNSFFTREIQTETRSGQFFTLHIIGQCMVINSEKMMVITMRDLTDIKAAQKENEKIQQQLNHASKLAALGTLGAGVAHELNNPLAGILGFTHAIQSHLKEDKVTQDFVQKIQKCADRMRRIIDHLRTVSRDTSRSELKIFEAIEPVHEALLILKTQVENLGIALDLKLPPEGSGPYVKGNPIDLCSVIQNLIVNARDALEGVKDNRVKRILLEVTQENGHVILSVVDNGPGIPETIREKIFEPFFTTKDVGKGTGLGLAIIHRIVHDHHGSLEMQTEIDVGTKFIVKLPLCAPPALTVSHSDELPQKPQESDKPIGHNEAKPHAVVVDDDEGITGLLEFFLKDHYNLTLFNEPQLAVEQMRNRSDVDLLITDMRMPKMSGLELLKILIPLMPKTTFVMITAHANTDRDVQEALRVGVNRVIGKPFPKPEILLEELAAAQKAHLDAKKAEAIEILVLDDEAENVEILEFYIGPNYSHMGFTDPMGCLESELLMRAKVIISDLNLGKMNGLQIFKTALEKNPQLGLLLITGSLVSNDFLDNIKTKLGGNLAARIVILQKPIDGSDALCKAIDQAIKKAQKLPVAA